jgi:DNA-binding beta-propeller fold protein YncE
MRSRIRAGEFHLAAWTAWAIVFLVLGSAPPAAAQTSPYQLFESGPVRPIALSPNGQKLFVANIPDGYLEIFDVGTGGYLIRGASVPVGLEPVAVAARNNSEVWVVNHLSDSVSIVDVASTPPRVKRTLLVGDEPRDIVFYQLFSFGVDRAFISTAHRGQHRSHPSIAAVTGAGDPQLSTEGIGRADVWVFDANDLGSAVGGVPEQIFTFFSDTPRALARQSNSVFVAAFQSGNRTTTVNQLVLAQTGRSDFSDECGSSGQGLGPPGPSANFTGHPAPRVGLILKRIGADWIDSMGCTWNTDAVRLTLPDRDVFRLNGLFMSPTGVFTGVGTTIFNMVVNPVTGKLYVSNTEANNLNRFEGPGNFGGSTVQGHLAESRITVIDQEAGTVSPKHLNQHIDYDQLHTDAGADHAAIEAQKQHSLSTPLQMVVSNTPGDQKVYVAAFGSAKIGVFDASDLEDPNFATNFDPTVASANYISTGGGPAGLALNSTNDILYVLTRFDQKIRSYVVSGPDADGLPLQSVRLSTPEPAAVTEGRRFLYDAVDTSGNGEASCASCHIFGDFDSLAWDLGNPDDMVKANPQPQIASGGIPQPFHPLKGPMTTQTLRGISTHGGMHWRGDRTNGVFGEVPLCTPPNPGSNAVCDEHISFKNFIVAFEGLLGMQGTISTADMEKFMDFALQLRLPPNPVANLDGQPTPDQETGEALFFVPNMDGLFSCNDCHRLDPRFGFFGTDGAASEEGETQRFKIPHLRNLYQKVGMFGIAFPGLPDTGEQVRGTGFLHDGSIDTLFNFLEIGPFALNATQSRQLEQFMLAFPSDIAPAVGQQVSIGPGSPGSCTSANCNACAPGETACQDVSGRIVLLQQRASANFESWVLNGTTPVKECELIAKTVEGGVARGYLRQSFDAYLPDDGGPAITEAALRARAGAAGQDIHYLCVPPGSGQRMGIDRDLDTVLDGVDNCDPFPNPAQADHDGDGIGDACEPVLLPEPGETALLLGFALLGVLRRARSPRNSRATSAGERASTPTEASVSERHSARAIPRSPARKRSTSASTSARRGGASNPTVEPSEGTLRAARPVRPPPGATVRKRPPDPRSAA